MIGQNSKKLTIFSKRHGVPHIPQEIHVINFENFKSLREEAFIHHNHMGEGQCTSIWGSDNGDHKEGILVKTNIII